MRYALRIDFELTRLGDDLRTRYGSRLREIVFFGSRARGDASAESDYDCLLVFDLVDAPLRTDLDRLAAEWLLDRGMVFAWIAVSEADLSRLRYEPFLQNARREGVRV